MAKKTKVKEIKAIQQPITKTQIDGTQDISYAGKVSIKVQRGNKTILTKQYHNNGMPDLFKFLCQALAGTYNDELRPCKIKLFCYDEANSNQENTQPSQFDWQEVFTETSLIGSDTSKPRNASPFVLYDTTPVVTKREIKGVNGNFKTSYETTFHFRIPGSLITTDLVHMIGLYSNYVYAGLEKEACAYYLLTERDSENKLYWAPLNLGEDKVSGNFSLIIDWTMSVTNKEAVVSTATASN